MAALRVAAASDPPSDGCPADAVLLATSTVTLAAWALERRLERHGARLTFSPSVHIPLEPPPGACTRPATAPRSGRRGRSAEVVEAALERAHAADTAGGHEVVLSPDGPSLAPLSPRDSSRLELLRALAGRIVDETGLLPCIWLDMLDDATLACLRPVCATVGLRAPVGRVRLGRTAGNVAARWLASLEAAGRLQVPLSVALPAGPPTARPGQVAALRAIAASHARHGHVQAVVVPAFGPAGAPAVEHERAWTVAAARLVLAPEVHLQAPPGPGGALDVALVAGADDLGPLAPLRLAPDGPEVARASAVDDLEQAAEAAGAVLAPRLALYPEWAIEADRWLDGHLRAAALARADAEGLARDGVWVAGGQAPPPDRLGGGRRPVGPPTRRRAGQVGELLEASLLGATLGEDDLVALFAARGREVDEVIEVADELRRRAVGDTVTFVVNRNINFTNICTFKCRFCAFSKGPRSLNLREPPYLLPLDEVTRRVAEAAAAGATEVCLQGGIHPRLDGEHYLKLLGAVRAGSDRIHVHGFSALEIVEGARRLTEEPEAFLARLRAAGLGSIPGTAAEILDDDIRAVLCPDKLSTDQWLDLHRAAHRVGLRSTVTIMFGAVEHTRHWARHLVRTRELQRETGGFTELVPLPFVHMATPLYLDGRARRGPTFREVLLVHAVGRIAFAGLLDNVQASWVKTGLDGLRQLLRAGCNDAGGTLMDEQIAAAAGATGRTALSPEELRAAIEPLGRPVEQRTTLYERPSTTALGR